MSKTKFTDPKLFSLISSLTGVEKRELSHFLASPFFNRKPELSALWQILLETPGEAETGWEKQALFVRLFPCERYDDGRLRYTFTFLREKIEWLLAYRHWDKQPAATELALSAAYRERGLEKHFRHAVERSEKAVNDMPFGQEKQDAAYRLELEKYTFAESMKRSRGSALQDVHDAFDRRLLSGKLRLACLMTAHQSVVTVPYDYSFLPSLIGWLEENPLLAVPEIGVYYHCYRALTENDEAYFRRFRSLLETTGRCFDPTEFKDILLLAINFCIRQANAGSQAFTREAFDLYRLGLTSDSLTERGVMSRFTLKNIVGLGLRLKEFDWVETFLHDCRSLVEERHRESSFNFNLAKLRFLQGNYGEAMPLLARVGDDDFLLMLDAKVLLLKMYFERGEWDALDSLQTSLKTFLRRKTSIGYHKEHYLSLLRYTQQLLSLKPNDRQSAAALRTQIEADETTLEKEWLLGRLK